MNTGSRPRFGIQEAEVFCRRITVRMPFRFGRSTLTEMPVLHLRLRVRAANGRSQIGVSAAGIPPLWFDKGEGKTHSDNIRDLSLSLRIALDHYRDSDADTVWNLHRTGEAGARRAAAACGLNGLTAGFGVALVDAALIDAACRYSGSTFHAALRADLFGWDPGAKSFLPAEPLQRIALRHTVGLSDSLSGADAAARVGDGLPETLVEVIRSHRPGYFKIKIGGEAAEARARLRAVAKILDGSGLDYRATLDGNEQFADMGAFASFLRGAGEDPALRDFWRRTLWIEQPVGRDRSLGEDAAPALRAIGRFKPVIIDESDSDDEAVDRALGLGYGGISAKNCKGVFRTLHSFRRVRQLAAEGRRGLILSSEDLTNTPIVPLQQDLCVAAALGIAHSERNGHHYVRGFDFLSAREREDALREYPRLYAARQGGHPIVRIEGGFLDVRDVNASGFGTRAFPDWEHLEPFLLPEARNAYLESRAETGRAG